jgi:hypothetical protein
MFTGSLKVLCRACKLRTRPTARGTERIQRRTSTQRAVKGEHQVGVVASDVGQAAAAAVVVVVVVAVVVKHTFCFLVPSDVHVMR